MDSVAPNGVRLTTLEVTFPRFVLAEFNTHRQFCLDGDTKLYFDLPSGAKSGTKRFALTIRELYDKWHNGAAPRINRSKTKRATAVEPDRDYTARELATMTGYADYTGIDDWVARLGFNRQPIRQR
ncbi:MAG: hypothetical protein JO113_05950, partial [Candidatus Eremiobacteraeota bacterium]|nr:hypothetical protein [Candidatus Eremiobacteraeota bacterium]